MNFIEEKLRKEASTISLLSSVIFLSVIQIIFFVSILTVSVTEIQEKGIIFLPVNLIFAVYYFAIPVIYCICISLFFNPKRIVSPINAQIMTVSFLIMMLIYKITVSSTEITDPTKLFLNVSGGLIFGSVLLIEIGWLQLLIVRKVVGLNFGSIERKTIEIDGFTPEKIIEKMKDSFLFVWGFNSKIEKEDKINIIKRLGGKKKWSGIITIGGISNKKSIISIIIFQSKTYSIEKTESTSKIMNEMIDNLKGKLICQNTNVIMKEKKTYDDFVSKKGYEICLDMIGSMLKGIRDLIKKTPSYIKIIFIVLTLILLLALIYAYYTNSGISEMLLNFIVPTIFGLILQIGSAISDAQRRKTPF